MSFSLNQSPREEAAGGYYGNSSGIMPLVMLPNSKLTLRVPLQTYYLAVSGFAHPDRSIPPDYPVRHSLEDLLSGTDREMMVALQLARGGGEVR